MAVRWDCVVKLRDKPEPAWEGARYRRPPHLRRLPLTVIMAVVAIAVIAAPSKTEKRSASQKGDEHEWLQAECVDGGGWGWVRRGVVGVQQRAGRSLLVWLQSALVRVTCASSSV